MSDQEPSIIALKDAVTLRIKAETAFVESPVRQSKSNGRVERAIRNWRDQYRALRHFLDHRIGGKLNEGKALSTWVITWSADVITNTEVKPAEEQLMST